MFEKKYNLDSFNNNFKLFGVDISKGMIEKCAQLNLYNHLFCKDIISKSLSISDIKNIFSNSDIGCFDGFDIIVSC